MAKIRRKTTIGLYLPTNKSWSPAKSSRQHLTQNIMFITLSIQNLYQIKTADIFMMRNFEIPIN